MILKTGAEWLTQSAEETLQRGQEIGRRLRAPVLVLLYGPLGAGKTTLTKGIISGLGAAQEHRVTSPTFTLVHSFGDKPRVYHLDLYRLTSPQDLEGLAVDDILASPAVVIVEWAEKLTTATDWPVIEIHLEHVSEEQRRIRIRDSMHLLGLEAAMASGGTILGGKEP